MSDPDIFITRPMRPAPSTTRSDFVAIATAHAEVSARALERLVGALQDHPAR